MVGGAKKKKGRNFGHINGVKTVKKTVETAAKFKIPFVTFYVFSTENWKRPKSEVNFLFKLITIYFKQELQNVISNGIKINIFGKISNLPSQIKSSKNKRSIEQKDNKKITVNLAINYGSKDEIISALKKIKKMLVKKILKKIYIQINNQVQTS